LLKQQQSSTTTVAQSNVEPVDSQDLPQVWQRLLDALRQKGPSLPALLSGAKLVGIDAGQVTVSYPKDQEPVVRILERNGKKDTIRDVLSGLLSQNVGLKFEFEQSADWPLKRPVQSEPRAAVRREVAPPPPTPEPSIRITDELRQQLASDELIRAVIDTLGAEIVKVE